MFSYLRNGCLKICQHRLFSLIFVPEMKDFLTSEPATERSAHMVSLIANVESLMKKPLVTVLFDRTLQYRCYRSGKLHSISFVSTFFIRSHYKFWDPKK